MKRFGADSKRLPATARSEHEIGDIIYMLLIKGRGSCMKGFIIFWLVTIIIVPVSVVGCSHIQVQGGDRMRLNLEREIMGTWTTEDEREKLVIGKETLHYTDESIGIEETHTYLTEDFDLEYNRLFLKPTKDNETGLFSVFEKIEYRDGSLFGGILISDVGYNETEFRKEW